MLSFLVHRGLQSVLGLAALGVAILSAGGFAWGSGYHLLAIILFVVGAALSAFAVVGAALLVFHSDAIDDEDDRPAMARVSADRGGVAAGRDIRAGRDVVLNPATTEKPPPRETPSFTLSVRTAPEGWIHLAVTNHAEAGVFHADVTAVENTNTEQTTPYSVKWRGHAAEDRHIVKEALIDVAHVGEPWYDDPSSSVIIIESGRRIGDWKGGRFTLHSHSEEKGWDVVPNPAQALEGMPPHFALFFEEIRIRISVVRVDSGEEVARTITVGFWSPVVDEATSRWEIKKGLRVEMIEG